MKDSSERRIIHHRVFNDSRAEYDEWWTMQYKTKFLWKTVWRDVCYYTGDTIPTDMKALRKDKV
jgi:hypothetical protein